jgi:histone-binding protein RBBP4
MITSASEDNVVMAWQPTMRIWAGDEFKVDEKELENDAMEGIEGGDTDTKGGKGKSGRSSASQSMSVSAASVSGDD